MTAPEGSGGAPQAGGMGCLARFFWFIGGNIVLVVSAVAIAQRSDLLSVWDAVFWATVLAMVVVRYWDIARCQGLTAEGQPATLKHWRRYVLLLTAVALAAWLAAHAWSRFAGG